MSLREYIENLRNNGQLLEIDDRINLNKDFTPIVEKNAAKAVIFNNIENSNFSLVSNLLSSKDQFNILIKKRDKSIYESFIYALNNPKEPTDAEESKTFTNKYSINLDNLPIPKFYSADGGRYLTSAIIFAEFPDTGNINMSIHRIMISGKNKGVIRLVPRDLYQIYKINKRNGINTPIALVIGYNPLLSLAASTPTPFGESELSIANALFNYKLKVIKTPKNQIKVPVDVEFVIEGEILADEEAKEGPFVDITGTKDDIRLQPVIKFNTVYHRDQPIFQAILPAHSEHFNLMGFPRAARIYENIKKIVPEVNGVNLTTGGSGWLHAVISINPKRDGDAKNVALAAFAAHPSLKWCTVVDTDINIYNCKMVEWATITRVGKGDIITIEGVRGSSLDPAKDKKDGTSIKIIVDATKKGQNKEGYERIVPFGY